MSIAPLSLSGLSYTDAVRNRIGSAISTELKSHFNTTLNQVPNIKEIILALMYRESTYNFDARGPTNSSSSRGTIGYAYLNASAISSKLSGGASAIQKANILLGLCGLGLGQVLGMYFVKGGNPDGTTELTRLRPDIASGLIVNPGDDIRTVATGESNLQNMVMACMIILEGKYKSVQQFGSGYGIISTQTYATKQQAAVAGYLGLGKSDVSGTTPQAYSKSICGGDIYRIANGSGLVIKGYTNVASVTPKTNGAGLQPISTPGC